MKRRTGLIALLGSWILSAVFLAGLIAFENQATAQVQSGGFIPILASSAIGSSSTSTPITGLSKFQNAFINLNVTAVPAGGAPTLDVFIQSSADQGTTWRDFAHFAQVTTATGTQNVQLAGTTAGAATALASSDAALAVNTVVQGPWGDRLRAKWTFVAGGSSGNYTASVSGIVK